jgi:hypothetical protein
MNRESALRSLTILILVWCAVAALSQAAVPITGSSATAAVESNAAANTAAVAPGTANPISAAEQKDAGSLQIFRIGDGPSGLLNREKDKAGNDIQSQVGLNGKLWVVLTQAPPLSPDKYALFMNGVEVKGLDPAFKNTYQVTGGLPMDALVFTLQRNKTNDTFWRELMGSVVGMHVPVVVSLGEQSADGKSTGLSIVGSPLAASSFQFEVIGPVRLACALAAVIAVISLVWGHARTRTTLRDSYLPQIRPSQQTYSLARWQMAFWFTLIFAAFVCLFVVLWDTNTITTQALMLMGISGATALAAVEIDSIKDSPADAANRGLQALGLKTYADVVRVQQEIVERTTALTSLEPTASLPDAQAKQGKQVRSSAEERRRQLQIEIQDRDNILRTYNAKIQPFLTQGWFKDITTDINGTAIHRLQAVCWTLALGAVFVITVYRTLAMPDFNANLLTLMGISSAGYVGFKYPEKNS